ncbi:MAG TPA: AraC family transcriptional regulator [Lysobacter sp.]
MGTSRLSSSAEEVARIAQVRPTLLEDVLQGETRVTGRWSHGAFEAVVKPMQEHVLSATHAGTGKATSIIDGRTKEAASRGGTITYLPRGYEGEFRCSPNTTSNIYLGHERLLTCVDHLAEGRSFDLLDCIHAPDDRLFTIMQMIADEADSPGSHSRLLLEQAVDLLCIQLLRAHSTLVKPLISRPNGLELKQIKRVTEYMRDNLAQDISLHELANLVGVSRFHFCTAFRRATGESPHAYLTRMRMEMASKLLKNTPLLIGDVALAVGYSAIASFSTAFRRYAGRAPREFRATESGGSSNA